MISKSPYIFEVAVQIMPKMTNTLNSMNWRARHGESQKIKRAVWACVWPYKPLHPFKRAKISLTRFSSKQPDYDGLVSSFKHVIDTLTETGIIVNDRLSEIGIPTYAWVSCPPTKGFIKIRVEEVPFEASGAV